MDSEIISRLEEFCGFYLEKNGVANVFVRDLMRKEKIDSGDKEKAEFYYKNTEKLLDYMRKNYAGLTGGLKAYMNELEYTTGDLSAILNKGKVIPIRTRKPALRLVQ